MNVASVVRVAKNFRVDGLRLVNPREYDPYRIEGIAHNTGDLIERIEIYQHFEDAIRDCVHVVGLTARERASKRRTVGPREAAAELVDRRAAGPVALVAGREDKGLLNNELDQCHALAVIPTSQDYRSLNLAQAVSIACYEVWLARTGGKTRRKKPRREAVSASAGELEQMFSDWEQALLAVDFFKRRESSLVLRSFREMIFRAAPDARETALLRAIGIEVVKTLARHGLAEPYRGSTDPDEGEKSER